MLRAIPRSAHVSHSEKETLAAEDAPAVLIGPRRLVRDDCFTAPNKLTFTLRYGYVTYESGCYRSGDWRGLAILHASSSLVLITSRCKNNKSSRTVITYIDARHDNVINSRKLQQYAITAVAFPQRHLH